MPLYSKLKSVKKSLDSSVELQNNQTPEVDFSIMRGQIKRLVDSQSDYKDPLLADKLVKVKKILDSQLDNFNVKNSQARCAMISKQIDVKN